MVNSVSIIERLYAAAYLVNSSLGLECTIVGPDINVGLELPPNHLGKCFCQRLQATTGKVHSIDHFLTRCEQISKEADNRGYAVYNCPFGLANIIIPAFDDKDFVAALQVGPIMTESSDELILKHGALSLGFDSAELDDIQKFLDSMPKGNLTYIVMLAKMLYALVDDESISFKSLSMDEYIDENEDDFELPDDLVCSIHEFIVDNYTDNNMSLDMVAKHVYVHPSYISKIFSRDFNTPFRSYVNGLRINLAAKLLVETNKSIGDICHEVGFSDHSYFNKIFKQARGVTPSEFRAQIAVTPDGQERPREEPV